MVWDPRKILQLKSWYVGLRVKVADERAGDTAWATVVDIDPNFQWFVVEWDQSGFIDRESVNDIDTFDTDGSVGKV
jgi:hypothetical protein